MRRVKHVVSSSSLSPIRRATCLGATSCAKPSPRLNQPSAVLRPLGRGDVAVIERRPTRSPELYSACLLFCGCTTDAIRVLGTVLDLVLAVASLVSNPLSPPC